MRLAPGLIAVALVVAACSGESSSGTSETVPPQTFTSESSSAGTGDDGPPVTEPVLTETPLPASSSGAEITSPVEEVDGLDDDTGVLPDGFTTATVRITKADGSTCDVCMWLADQSNERRRGMMGVTDLGNADGMAFLFDRSTNGAFFMFQTVTPLSIAWFAADGGFVSSTDMDPCLSDDSAECERFAPGGQYLVAIEVLQGDLESIGITPDATAEVVAGTEAEGCPLTD